jgi:predicted transcriptional regulator of viral defense system
MESIRKLKKLRTTTFSTADARRLGVSTRMLTYLVSQGEIERRAHGLYCFPDYIDELDLHGILQELLKIVPDAIVGLETALQLYNLSDEPTRTIHLIVSQSNAPTRRLPDVRFFRVRMPLSQFKTQKVRGSRVTTIEQTIVDLLRAGHSISDMVKIFHGAQRQRMTVDLSQLMKLGEQFHVKGKVARVIEAVY